MDFSRWGNRQVCIAESVQAGTRLLDACVLESWLEQFLEQPD